LIGWEVETKNEVAGWREKRWTVHRSVTVTEACMLTAAGSRVKATRRGIAESDHIVAVRPVFANRNVRNGTLPERGLLAIEP